MLESEGEAREPTDKRTKGSWQARNVAVMLAILIISSLFVIWWFMPRAEYCTWNPTDYLNVRVETSIAIEYEMYLSIPIDASGEPWYMVDSLQIIEGNATWSVATTPHGVALRITGKESIFLRAAGNASLYPYSGFSPVNRTGFGLEGAYSEFFVFVNASGYEEMLSMYVGSGTSTPDGQPTTTVYQASEGTLGTGWQEVVGHTSVDVC